ncbi:MAG: hypothetical protein WCJ13_06875 [Coriobacteriia bacterium]
MREEQQMCNHLLEITRWCEEITLLNDPHTITGTSSKSANKPGSRAPGSTQCRSAVVRAEKKMRQCAADLRAIWDGAQPRERHESPAEVIGGVQVGWTDEDKAAVAKRIKAERRQLIAARRNSGRGLETKEARQARAVKRASDAGII